MDNNHQELHTNIEDNIRDAFTDSLRDYVRNYPQINNNTSTSGIRHITIQLTQLLREIIAANTSVMNNYSNTINEYNENVSEITRLIRTLSVVPHNIPSSPINPVRTPPRTSVRQPPRTSIRQPTRTYDRQTFRNTNLNRNNSPPEFLFSFLTQPPDLSFNQFHNIFQDVPVYPTTQQIENAIEIFEYSSNMVLSNIRCPISLADFNDGDDICRIRYCGHCFIHDSLLHWFRTSVACPMCRYDIRNYSNNDETNNDETNNETNNDETNNETNNDETNDETNNETNNDETNNDEINNESNDDTNTETNNSYTTSFTFTDASNQQSGYQDLTDISNNPITNSFGNSIQSLLMTALNEGLSEYNTTITSANGELQVNLPISIENYYDISNN